MCTRRMVVLRILFLFLACVLMVSAQRPSFGGCPEKNVPMPDFDLSRYLGVWYEAERSFTVLEAGARCVKSNYTQTADGKVHVSNEVLNRVTGIKRVLEGELKTAGKAGEGKISIKYSIPIPLETTYHVLDTDYDSYSVVWNCVNFGIFNAQYAWLMTRERQSPGPVLQQAYGVLDQFGIPRTFFVKTDQKDCDIAAAAPDVVPLNRDGESQNAVKTPALEMLPPEPDTPKETESEKPAQDSTGTAVANPEKPVPVMEDVPKAPAEASQDNKLPSEPVNVPEKVNVPAEPMAEPAKLEKPSKPEDQKS